MSGATVYPCRVCADEVTTDGLLGSRCTAVLRAGLRDLPELMRELRTTLTRQSKSGAGVGGKSCDSPMPFSVDASWTGEAVENTIGTWIRTIGEDYSEDLYTHTPVPCRCVVPFKVGTCPGPHIRHDFIPGGTMTSWCAWLLARMHRIRGHVAVEQIFDELTNAVQTVRRSIDRPAEREFVTTCSLCGKGVYSSVRAGDDVWVPCRECKRVAERDPESGDLLDPDAVPEYQAGPERTRRYAALRSSLLPAAEVVVAVGMLRGKPLSPGTFRSWVHRWQEGVTRRASLAPAACRPGARRLDDDGQPTGPVVAFVPLYRVDEVMVLAAEVESRSPAWQKIPA